MTAHSQNDTQRNQVTADSAGGIPPAKDSLGERPIYGRISLSSRLRKKDGASVFGGKYRYSSVVVFTQPGSHFIVAAGINGQMRYLFAKDAEGNKIPATYVFMYESWMACFALPRGGKPCYVIDFNDIPELERRKLSSGK